MNRFAALGHAGFIVIGIGACLVTGTLALLFAYAGVIEVVTSLKQRRARRRFSLEAYELARRRLDARRNAGRLEAVDRERMWQQVVAFPGPSAESGDQP